MNNLLKPTLALASALLLTASAGAQIVVNSASDLTWYDINTNSGHGSSLSGSTLNITSSTATDATNIAFANFTSQTLGVGYSISLTFTVTAGTVANQDNNFRFGLFNSGGTLQTADAAGNNPESPRNDLGYKYRLSTDPSSTSGNQSRYYFTNGGGSATALTSNKGTQTQLGNNVGTGVILSNSSKDLELKLTNTDGTNIKMEVFIDGTLQDNGRTVAAATYTFDQVAFSMANTNSVGYSISDLQVTAVPEPSTYAAILGALALAGVALRRRQKSRK